MRIDRRAPQRSQERRRQYDPLAAMTAGQRHQHAMQAIRLRNGQVPPLPECFQPKDET